MKCRCVAANHLQCALQREDRPAVRFQELLRLACNRDSALLISCKGHRAATRTSAVQMLASVSWKIRTNARAHVNRNPPSTP